VTAIYLPMVRYSCST